MPAKTKHLNPRQALLTLRQGWGETGASRLPFGPDDISAGVENELQAVVLGTSQSVDLPLTIRQSRYYANVQKRMQRALGALGALDDYLRDNPQSVWENSWVRLPLSSLHPATAHVLEQDLLADKQDPAAGRRQDEKVFFCRQGGQDFLRIPVSYLLKLALVQAVEAQPGLPRLIAHTGRRFTGHYLSDNTSPETFSFHVTQDAPAGGLGAAVATETVKRFLLTSLLAEHARRAFALEEHGQKSLVYFTPHPPVRQKQLNAAIPNSFYRELFMSPCLSGWDWGEKKHRYMHLCHQVLSRSQLNTLVKLREAGIIQNNLMVLPHTSNISLANNGTHLSLGSRLLSRALADGASGFGPAQEKYVGDLAIKFCEHFLPLFVGSYSAAPYRLDFQDFHPERVLGFLPHELDYTHLRMLWRRWKKKAQLKVLGVRLTPFGPQLLDNALAWFFRLRGDLVPDFRLVDYLAAVLSSEESPALDGRLGNQKRLKQDLAQAGVFDETMATYLLCRQREHARAGYAGFEDRHYSLFPSLVRDMAPAMNLQALLFALAFSLIAQGRLRHADIPGDPQVESERRQIFFGAAVGVPTFYVHRRTGNRLLLSLIHKTKNVRLSRRYPNYLRVYNLEYRLALVEYLRHEAAELGQGFGGPGLLGDLQARLQDQGRPSASQELRQGILERAGARNALSLPAAVFNREAEAYYREQLRRRHLAEGLEALARDLAGPQMRRSNLEPEFRAALDSATGGHDPAALIKDLTARALEDRLEGPEVLRLINLLITSLAHDGRQAPPQSFAEEMEQHAQAAAPIH